MNYFEESFKILFQFVDTNDDSSLNIQSFLNNFNAKQTIEKQIIDKKIKSLRSKFIYRTESTPFINSNIKPNSHLIYNKNNKTHLFGMTHPFTSNIQLFDSQNIYSNNNVNNNVSSSKSGYLYKRAMHTRVGKSWLKRKCSTENGIFLIYHSDVCFCLFKVL